ncbi:HIL-like protein [Mya arenaria]|uniref:HIL-like protein n=1 Tax=Mya arenaria TaxID=6604 RepID=A0ABY7FK04_MYAAR|nr:HIL-like protein [Mya arenaria]
MGCTSSQPPPREPTPLPPPPRQRTPLPRDRAQIEIDRGKDEDHIRWTEDGYPDPLPPSDDPDVKIKDADRWYDDDEFNKASEDVDLFDTEVAVDDVSMTSVDDGSAVPGSKTALSLSHIKPSTKAKPTLRFDRVDAHARKADPTLLDSFDTLVSYLTTPWEGDRHRQIRVARALVVWLSIQTLDEGASVEEPSLDTPRGLLKFLKLKRMTYPTCYAILCRKAGLKCVVIDGLVKAAPYEPGDDSVSSTNWNAVFCEYGWQLVHPYWVCRALCGHQLAGWTKSVTDRTEGGSVGVIRNAFQNRYFMPKPAEFLYECFPNKKAWQLVEPDMQVPNRKAFLEMPYLLPPFHGLGLQLVSDRKCHLESTDGFCKIELKGRNTNSHLLNLQYELFKKGDEDNQDKSVFPRMVFNYRANEYFVFEIRFPTEGTYKLVIYGGPYKYTALRLCEFRIDCKKTMPSSLGLLPLCCDDIGYGPGPVCMAAGLLMPSKPNGLLPVNKGDKKLTTEIKFQIRDDYVRKHEYSVALYGGDDNGSQAACIDVSDGVRDVNDVREAKLLKLTITKEFQLAITVQLPSEGEFGLTVCERIGRGNEVKHLWHGHNR